jgi:hypothetical protein
MWMRRQGLSVSSFAITSPNPSVSYPNTHYLDTWILGYLRYRPKNEAREDREAPSLVPLFCAGEGTKRPTLISLSPGPTNQAWL